MLTLPEKLKQTFEEQYAQLNSAQKEAVDAIEGPVMVIAGPGTGKTQILACRIARILLETDAAPNNILCLTYTDAGVVAMRKRLLKFIGSDAYRVNVHTFHSFCNKVIQDNSRILRKPELEALSDLERVQFIKDLIDGFPNDHPLKRLKGEIYHDLGNLASLFSTMKREGWDSAYLCQHIDHYVNEVVPAKFLNKKQPEKGLTVKGQEELRKFARTKAAVQAFDTYQQILADNNRYDFDDMINWVVKLLEENQEVLLGYQESLQYILVDEYQDTSGSQNRIVELLCSYWEDDPNLFVVGDDDQSIYRFQGANIENMMDIRERLQQNMKTIILTQNYRSVQPILDAATSLISRNTRRLISKIPGLSKELVAAREELQHKQIIPVVRVYDNEFSENVHIAASIKALVDGGTLPGKIAVLYREHKFGDDLQKFLQMAGVPFYVKRPLNLLEDVFINNILNICRYIDLEIDTPNGGEYLLFEILHYGFFDFSPLEIARITREKKGSLRDHIAAIGAAQSSMLFPSDELSGKLQRMSQLLNLLQKEAFNLPLQQWFEKLINEAGVLAFVNRSDEKLWQMEKLSCLFNHIKEETHRHPLMNLRTFMELINLMDQNKLPLPLVQTTGNEKGVNLLSCHGAKGLEFEHVFLLGARNDVWENKRKNNKGFPLPPSVVAGSEEDEALADEEDYEELRRLFYVAVTRAEQHLYVSYPRLKSDGKELVPSVFVEEVRAGLELKEQHIALDDDSLLRFHQLRYGVVSKPVMEAAEKDYVEGLLAKFVMNVSALNNYLDCPLSFYYNNVVRVPSAKTESASFGTAVHDALKNMFNESKNLGRFPDEKFFLANFQRAMQKEREHFMEDSFRRFMDHGAKVLPAYHAHAFNVPAPSVFLTEYPLDNVSLDEIPLKGFTDLISFDGNNIVITDFKTGKFKAEHFKRPGDPKQQLGGNYWRQAAFYKILVDLMPKAWKVDHVVFEFVEPDNNGKWYKQRLDITAQDEAEVKQQITDTWTRIRNHDFYTGCGKPDCSWCSFTRDNKLYVRLEDEEAMEPSSV